MLYPQLVSGHPQVFARKLTFGASSNQAAGQLAGALMPWATDLIQNQPLNMLDMLIHPEGFTKLLLRDRLGNRALHAPWPRVAAPLMTLRFATSHGELAFFRMYSTFGSPQDITLPSLRVEHMFAADEATKNVLLRQVGCDPG